VRRSSGLVQYALRAERTSDVPLACPGAQLTHVQTMRVILATDDGSTFTVDVDPELQLQDLQALLEAEVRSATRSDLS